MSALETKMRGELDLVALCLGFPLLLVLFGGYAIYQYSHQSPKTTISAPSTLPVAHTWTKTDSLAYANDQLQAQAHRQFACLKTLWHNESKWNPKAFNPVKVMGKNAGGIPQLLGLSPLTPPTEQIDRGLSYIFFRYTLPCSALEHYKKVRWY